MTASFARHTAQEQPTNHDTRAAERYFLPRIPKSGFALKILNALGLLKSAESLGLYKPYYDPTDGTAYGEAFRDAYAIKNFYKASQRHSMPSFALARKHAGKRFVVFGNGPSLAKFPFDKMQNAITLGTNTSSEFVHANYVLISSSFAFLRAQPFFDFRKSVLLVAGSMWNGNTRRDLWNRLEDRIVPVETAEGDWSIADDKITGSGHNVGQMAVDVALLMGAKSILLVGCDGYKKRDLASMYAGRYDKRYRKSLADARQREAYEQMLSERDEDVHQLFARKQAYCQERGVAFGVWGDDCQYDRLNKVKTEELGEWL